MPGKLPASVYSPDHLRFCVEELQAYTTMLRQRERGARSTTEPELSTESLAILDMLATDERTKPEAVTAVVEGLETALQKAPTFGITLSAPAPHHLKEELADWLRDNVDASSLVEFHVNPDIAGGMILRTASKVYDFTWRQKILEKSELFAGVLEHV